MVRQWIWCDCCERCFVVNLSRRPNLQDDEEADEYGELPLDFAEELEAQLGVEYPDKRVIVKCFYDDCDGDLESEDFLWWEEFRQYHPEMPFEPELGKAYPFYPPTGRVDAIHLNLERISDTSIPPQQSKCSPD